MSELVAFGASVAGMAALSLAMERHARQALSRPWSARARRGLRGVGAAALAFAGMQCVDTHGPGVGLVAWCGWLNAAGLIVVLLLAHRPRALGPVGVAGAFAAASVGLHAYLSL